MVGTGGEQEPDSSTLPDGLQARLDQFLPESDSGNGSGVDREPYEAVVGYVQEQLAEQTGGHNEIDTRSGKKITPLDPDHDKIELSDIAHGLSNVGRFGGQGKEFYSVARHSVHVSLEVEARRGSLEPQRYALVHDAAEAYLSDVPGPVKRSLPGYKHAERRLDAAVVDALGLEAGGDDKERVERADGVVGGHELAEQFPDAGHGEVRLRHEPGAVDTNTDSKELFLERACNLGLW